ncbi:MAG: GGDEF domain-containing protein [Treponema sp.]|nr:GGDEF domain-containing protein [Treponema sp.]
MNEEIINSHSMLSAISRLSLFSKLDKNEFKTIAGVLKLLHIKKGEEIFKEGDPGEDMYIHFSGVLSAFVTQSDGTRRRLFDVNSGEFFGEMSIISHEPRSATICAAKDAEAVKISEKDFYRIITDYPMIGFKLLRAISEVQNRWLNQTSKSFSDLIRWGETARKRAITDEMTGIYNRRFLDESIKERFLNQSMKLRIMSLLMMDLDKIHGINETYGIKAGDLVIISAADIIRSCVRSGDIPARLSGDEFAVLLPDTDEKAAAKIAERIRKLIEEKNIEIPASPGADETTLINTRTSIGIAAAPKHAKTKETLEDAADIALRKAKDLGRNRVEVYCSQIELI